MRVASPGRLLHDRQRHDGLEGREEKAQQDGHGADQGSRGTERGPGVQTRVRVHDTDRGTAHARAAVAGRVGDTVILAIVEDQAAAQEEGAAGSAVDAVAAAMSREDAARSTGGSEKEGQ